MNPVALVPLATEDRVFVLQCVSSGVLSVAESRRILFASIDNAVDNVKSINEPAE
jgi:hypothetical protein